MGLICRYYTVLRLALPRTSIKDIMYQGKRIPKGSVFFLNSWACNMGTYLKYLPDTTATDTTHRDPY